MAEILDACINVRKCHTDPKTGSCTTKGHENTNRKYWVKLINFLFGVSTIVLLAYLGVLLDTSTIDHGNEIGLLYRWSKLNFFGHIIVLAWYIIYLILK
jgi:hypothetical protein